MAWAGEAEPLSLAEPGLDGIRPELVDRGWVAIGQCAAGVQAPPFERIAVHQIDVPGGYEGMTFEQHGSMTIVVEPGDDAAFVTLHELAHHWVGWRPRALREGFAELLAECAYRALTGQPDWRVTELGPPEMDRTDLVGWTTDDGLDAEAVSRRYRASYWLARSLEDRLTPAEKWDPWAAPSWSDLWEKVHTPEIRHASPFIEAHADDQVSKRVLFLIRGSVYGDLDEDGIRTVDELRAGTEPFAWDTDGDGWWDGAAPPAGAFARPAGDACLGVATADGMVAASTSASSKGMRLQARVGEAIVVPGLGAHEAVWWTLDQPVEPCADTPPHAGTWPLADVDPDGDRIVTRDERVHGTDPNLRDTDGDGWWDGADPPPGAIPIDGPGWSCLGRSRFGAPEVRVVGPDAGLVRTDPTLVALNGGYLHGVTVSGPSAPRAWLEVDGERLRRCTVTALVRARRGLRGGG